MWTGYSQSTYLPALGGVGVQYLVVQDVVKHMSYVEPAMKLLVP
jgi:hypothetical protein